MQVKKIIITGAAGMLGTAVIDHLMNFYSVTSTDQIIGFSPRGVRWHQMDLLEMDGLARWIRLEKPDAVVHCAALVNVDACEKDQDLAVRLHEGTTKTIGDVLQSYGGKLIYISTDSVFNGKKDNYSEELILKHTGIALLGHLPEFISIDKKAVADSGWLIDLD